MPTPYYSILRPYMYTPMNQDIAEERLWRIAFPDEWEKQLQLLGVTCFQTKTDAPSRENRSYPIPYRSLNSILMLAFPSLITRGFQKGYVHGRFGKRRLLSSEDIEKHLESLAMVIRAWARYNYERWIKPGMIATAQARSTLEDTIQLLSSESLSLESYAINPSRPDLNTNLLWDNRDIDDLYYQALPTWLVSRLAGRTFYLDNIPFHMLRAQKFGQDGVELVSWPPHQIGKGYMSLVLEFDVQTLPTASSQPIVYPRWHVRRWVHQSLISNNGKSRFINLPHDQLSAVQVRNDVPWLRDEEVETGDEGILVSIPLELRSSENKFVPAWGNSLAEIIAQIGGYPIVSAEDYVQEPLRLSTNPEMACRLSGKIAKKLLRGRPYPIGDGLFPRNICSLMEQLDGPLAELGVIRSSEISLHRLSVSLPEFPKDEYQDKDEGMPEDLPAEGQEKIRTALLEAIHPMTSLSIELYYKNHRTALALWRHFYQFFGLHRSFIRPTFDFSGINTTTPEGLQISVRAMPNPHLRLALSEAKPASYRTAVQNLARDTLLTRIDKNELALAILEMDNLSEQAKKLDRAQDMKDPTRFIFARSRRLTQYIVPVQEPPAGEIKAIKRVRKLVDNKARQSILDLRRQLGYMDNDLIELLAPTKILPGTDLVGLYLKQRNITFNNRARGYGRVFFPIAVRLTVGCRNVMALVPNEEGESNREEWRPYHEVALRAGSYQGAQLYLDENSDRRKNKVLSFVKRIIDLERQREGSILFVSANVWKMLWTWLQDKRITFDQMELNGTTFQSDNSQLLGGDTVLVPNMRVIRYRFDEVPAYTSLDPRKPEGDQAGYGHGIAALRERVFYSIAQKSTMYRPSNVWNRVGIGSDKDARMSNPVEVVPAFLQPGDIPENYAKVFHLLRMAASHWANGMTDAPLPVHLGETLVNDYLGMRTLLELEEQEEDPDSEGMVQEG